MTIRVKICGITNNADAQAAIRFGADALGFNFYRMSPRFITTHSANDIINVLPPFVEPVGLFVNDAWPDVQQSLKQLPTIRTVQWHGDNAQPCPFENLRFIPAFAVREEYDLQNIRDFLEQCRDREQTPTAVLVDGHDPVQYGGTGNNAPWQLLADFDPGVPLILAGGLTPENVAEAIRIVRPIAVDVASGVESEPGRKDHDKMKRFIENAKNAFA